MINPNTNEITIASMYPKTFSFNEKNVSLTTRSLKCSSLYDLRTSKGGGIIALLTNPSFVDLIRIVTLNSSLPHNFEKSFDTDSDIFSGIVTESEIIQPILSFAKKL